jgi:hypothetical protein
MMAQTVTPLPSIGDVVPGRDVAGRELRISGHPDSDRVVLSIWQDGRCQATVRLARADVPDVISALAAGLVPQPIPQPQPSQPQPLPGSDGFARPAGTLHQLHPNELHLDQPDHRDQLQSGVEPGSFTDFTDAVTSLREATDRFATTVIARVRRFTGH